ncbi:MAG: metal ABC transporter substrate-binding protein [Acidimicrobiales bacterium]
MVVTYSVAAAVVADLVGTAAWVEVLIPDGTDPHEWRASAKDLESLRRATVIVDNGLGLEASLADAIEQASASGVIRFSLADHVKVRTVGDEDAAGHENHAETADGSDDGSDGGSDGGVRDPHLWTDPVTMRQWVAPLAELLGRHGIDVQANVAPLQAQLDRLDAEVAALIDAIPPPQRRLVTGHESLGYFAQRYGLELIGAVIPSFSSQAGAAAGALADLVAKTEQAGVRSIFAEAGTPAATIDAVAQDAGVTVVALSTHALPPDRTYAGFVRNLAVTISGALT